STERDADAVFVRIHSVIVFLAGQDWNDTAVRSALADFLRPNLSAGSLGIAWQAGSGELHLDGLWPLAVAVRGKYLFVSDNLALLNSVLANWSQKPVAKPAIFAAAFNHAGQRENFLRLTGVLDQRKVSAGNPSMPGQSPQFFSDNVASISSALSGVSSERITIHDSSDKVFQTVTYAWTR